jgi:hypothetical protein
LKPPDILTHPNEADPVNDGVQLLLQVRDPPQKWSRIMRLLKAYRGRALIIA